MSGRAQDVLAMCRAHALRGTTSILPTTLAAPKDMLLRAVSAIEEARRADAPFRILGAHMEGPCLNPAQAGAQAPGALTLPKDLNLDEFLDACPSMRMMALRRSWTAAWRSATGWRKRRRRVDRAFERHL